MKRIARFFFAVIAVLSLVSQSIAEGDVKPLDLTRGGKIELPASWDKPQALGPTGAFGWMWTKPQGGGRAQDTEGSTQILVMDVASGSPAASSLKKDDVIIGVVTPLPPSANGMFVKDCRKELSASITEAEKVENGGKLVLKVWRNGKVFDAQMILKVMGEYSQTAPVKCAKTEKIIENACDYLEKNGLGSGISGHMNALGLLATGDRKYVNMVQDYVRAAAEKCTEVNPRGSTWSQGYSNLLFTEYYLATQDRSVLPAIEALSKSLAMGRSGVGTWGHNGADPDENGGKLHGRLGGYGAMNQASLPATISLALAVKCGVQNSEVSAALAKAASFFRWYVDKGGIPYGDHAPVLAHATNGKSASAAVLFNILGDQEAATFFSRMVVASYRDCESGHTGNYFSFLWSALGAGCTGEQALAAFMRETRWYEELQRRADGNFHYQSQLYNDHGKYTKWDATGARLLHYCMPRHRLYITGRQNSARELTSGEVADTIAAGRKDLVEGRSTPELLALLKSWSPVVRDSAAVALSRKEDVVNDMLGMLDSNDRYTKYGACRGLSCAGRSSKQAGDRLVKLAFTSKDETLRYHAISAFQVYEKCWKWGADRAGLYGATREFGPDLLKLASGGTLDEKTRSTIAGVLFYAGASDVMSVYPRGSGIDTADPKLLIPAIQSLLQAANGGARSDVGSTFEQLPESVIKELWGDIYLAAKEPSPSGVMFSDGVRLASLKLMAKHGIKEGITVGLEMIKEDRWGKKYRIWGGIEALSYYEGAVKEHLEELKKIAGGQAAGLKEAFDRIEKGKSKSLISIAPQIAAAEKRLSERKAVAGSMAVNHGATSGLSPAAPAPAVPAPGPVVRKPRSLNPENKQMLDKVLLKALAEMSDEKLLKPVPLRLALTRARVWLAKAESGGKLTFQVVGGKQTEDMKWSDLSEADQAVLARLVAEIKTESSDAQALAGVYMEILGDVAMADKYYAKAGVDTYEKFVKLF